jgi:hypothetical protein
LLPGKPAPDPRRQPSLLRSSAGLASPRSWTLQAAKHDANGAPLRSFQGLLDHLSTLTRNTCQVPGTEITFERLVEPTETQRRAFELLGANVPLRLL